jgi:hypothetical protein
MVPGTFYCQLVKQGFTDASTEFHFKPELDLAMRWAIVLERLFLNAGGEISFLELVLRTLDWHLYDNDVENEVQSSKQIENSNYPAVTRLYLGATFNPTANIELQSSLGVLANNSVSVFNSSVDNAGNGDFLTSSISC